MISSARGLWRAKPTPWNLSSPSSLSFTGSRFPLVANRGCAVVPSASGAVRRGFSDFSGLSGTRGLTSTPRKNGTSLESHLHPVHKMHHRGLFTGGGDDGFWITVLQQMSKISDAFIIWGEKLDVVQATVHAMEYLNQLGLPWWCVISIATVATRLITLPITHFSQRNNDLVEYSGELDTLKKMLKTMPIQQRIKAAKGLNYSKVGYRSWKLYTGILLRIPPALVTLWSIYYIVRTNTSIENGGIWFFSDLSAFDPFLRLDLMYTAAMLGTIYLSRHYQLKKNQSVPWIAQWVTRLYKGLIAFMFIFLSPLPPAVHWYLLNSVMISLANIVYLQNRGKQLVFQDPKLENAVKNPDMYDVTWDTERDAFRIAAKIAAKPKAKAKPSAPSGLYTGAPPKN